MTEVAKMERQEVAPESTVAPMVQMIERIAMDPSVPIDRLEKMLDMKERMDVQEAERAFNAAFASASAEFPSIPMNGRGHNSKPYALLKDIISHTRPILSKHGLSLSWDTEVTDKVKVTACLRHIAGHSAKTAIVLPLDTSGSKNGVQAVGSSQAYGQRYTGQAILGLSLGDDTDDDGKAAGGDRITPEQFTALRDLIEQAEADEGKLLAHFKVEHLGELPATKYGTADAMLRKKIAQKGGSDA